MKKYKEKRLYKLCYKVKKQF